MIYAVIIAGGKGQRFWPLVRHGFPKCILTLPGKTTLLQKTIERIRPILPSKNILIVTNYAQSKLIRKKIKFLNRNNFIIEPFAKDTAAAVGLAAAVLLKKDKNATMVVLPADQIIKDESKFQEAISFGILVAQLKDCLVTLGLKPNYPATGFGYIKPGLRYKSLQGRRIYQVYKADKFIEKPSLYKAKRLLKSGYLWNGGVFIWKASCILENFKRYSPKIYKNLFYIQNALGKKNFNARLKNIYSKMPAKSVDYAVMERSKDVYVIKTNLRWQDVGSWSGLWQYLKKTRHDNVILDTGNFKGIDTRGCIILSDKRHLIAAVKIKDTIIIHTKDATLVCPKDEAGQVKDIVNLLEKTPALKGYI